jgi:L-serine dehydratase
VQYKSLNQLLEMAGAADEPMWRIVLLDDAKERQVPQEEVFETMRHMYQAMKKADASYDGGLRSPSGLAGGDGARFENFCKEGRSILSPFLSEVITKAVKMGESNACMKQIVAAPTAGSCGIIPAVFLSYEEHFDVTEEQMVEAMFVCAGIGAVIAENASISGAEGGCQAEIGSASAMAAAGLTYLCGGDGDQITHAAALALKNMLGLTCDPVAGLVEVPCIKRNASGAVNAVTSSQLALSGIRSQIPPDEVIDAMRRIGNLIPACLRETGEEGLATTECGIQIRERMQMME